jgi:hypothetical protein
VPTLTRTVVAAPQATPPVHSLVRSAITNVDAEPGWERGLTYAPETPGGYRAWMRCTTETYANLSLVDGPVILNAGAPVKVHRALGIVEQALGEALRGERAYVHLSRETLALFGYLTVAGNLLSSFSGNLIVADAGYPGTAPIGTADAPGVAWIYGPGPPPAYITRHPTG